MALAMAASGILGYTDADATNGKIVTVGSVVYTLKTGALVAAGDVKIVAGKPDSTVRNLGNAINGSGGIVGTDYFAIGQNAAAYAVHDPFENSLLVTARVAGTAGNLVVLTTDEATFTAPGGGLLTGGIAGDSIVSWALVTIDEAKSALRVRGADADAHLTRIIPWASDIVERALGFRPVADLGTGAPEADVDEYHDLANPQGFVYVLRRPLRSVTEVYVNGTLIPSSDYTIDTKAGMVSLANAMVTPPRRVLGGYNAAFAASFFPEDAWRFQGRYFPAGTASARVKYKGGFATTETVDGGLKSITLDIIARIYRTEERKSQGVASEIAQGFTVATKYDPKVVSEDLKARLREYATLTTTARK